MNTNPKKKEVQASSAQNSSSQGNGLTDFKVQLEKRIGNLVQGKAKDQVIAQVTALIKEDFSGPLPHPRHLGAYEEICPGAADRIIAMAETMQRSQIEMTNIELANEANDRKLGMILGFGALAVLALGAVICALYGHEVVAGAFIGVGALGTVGRFVFGRNQSGKS